MVIEIIVVDEIILGQDVEREEKRVQDSILRNINIEGQVFRKNIEKKYLEREEGNWEMVEESSLRRSQWLIVVSLLEVKLVKD